MKRTNQQTSSAIGIKIPVLLFISVTLMATLFAFKTDAAVQSIRIQLPATSGPIAQRASEILAREITERSGAKVSSQGKADFTIELAVAPGIGTEGFTIADDGNGKVKITGNDENGLLYGVGKFLHTSRYDQGGFTPGVWRGTDVPKDSIRGMYFATHFSNWYEAAPEEQVVRYVDDMALWGCNTLAVWFQVEQYQSFDDPLAQKNLKRLRDLFIAAKKDGMKTAYVGVWNTGFPSAPENIRAVDCNSWHSGFGTAGICPSNPSGLEYLQKLNSQLLDNFSGIGPDYVIHWPWDTGGCGCKQCWPWGGNGFVKLSKEVTKLVRSKFPPCKFIVSTWCFDYGANWAPPGEKMEEWEELNLALLKDETWADYIMATDPEDFPIYPLKHGVPGGLPMMDCPEITMFGQYPWGSYGTNAFPNRLQRIWGKSKEKLIGGIPYSEGIWDDINKIICLRFYWNPDRKAVETVKEYAAYEFSPEVADDVLKAIQIFEQNHNRQKIGKSAEEAFDLIQKANEKLMPQVRRSWRWRLVYLRAQIDRELYRNGGKIEGETLQSAFEELTSIYHAVNPNELVRPLKITNPITKGEPAPKAFLNE